MNPNAASFNPFAPSFVPSQKTTQAPAKVAQPPPVQPQPVATPVEQPKKEEIASSWEDAADKATDAVSKMTITEEKKEVNQTQPEKVAISAEEKKELERIAAEEGTTAEALLQEEEVGVVQELEEDKREHLNIVFIGHVDAGKSTISGQILLLTGQVDARTIQKYQEEAKAMNRESWYLAYAMDTNIEEREKGKTVEVGRAVFETENKRYTILDAPGHKNYVPNMIGGASQADVAVLVISAKKGEFESGFTKGGQTREHALLAKTLGVFKLIIVVNKMDDDTVKWAKERYDEIIEQLTPYIKSVGYNIKTDVIFIPVSGLKAYNLKDPAPKSVCSWYDGPTLFGALDGLKGINRLVDFPLRIPVMDKFKDRGMVGALGKIEAGILQKGQIVSIYPNKATFEVVSIIVDDTKSVKKAHPGENVRVSLKGVDEESISRGFVVCDPKKPVACQAKFEAQVAIVELLPHKPVFTAGYTAVIHIHTAVEECTITVLIEQLDKKTGQVVQKKPKFVKNGAVVRCMIECAQPLCVELFKDVAQLGRFTLRDEGKTIAIGKITALQPKKKKTEKSG